jgi:hypothetical protein
MADPKNENVTVVLTRDPSWPDGIKKEFQSNLGSGSQLTFRNNNHPGFNVNFVISDPDNTGYLWPQNKQDALWSKKIPAGSNECLTAEEHWQGFQATGVSADFRTLTVSNPNRKQQRFTFTLRFTLDPQNGPCIDWDPIGDDQNGPRSSWGIGTTTTAAAIGAGGGAIYAFATNEMVTASTITMDVVIGAVAGFIVGLVVDKMRE